MQALHSAEVRRTAWVWHSPLLWHTLSGSVSGEHSSRVVRPNCTPILHPLQLTASRLRPLHLLLLKCICLHSRSHKSCHPLVVTHHMQKGSRLSPSLLFIIVVWGESLGTRLLKEHYWRQLEITGHRGCHSHRLYSHSCEHRSKLREALFGGLTVDHIDFWGFDQWPYCISTRLCTFDFKCWPLTTRTFMELYRRMRSDSTPSLVYGVKMHSYSCDYWV